MLGVRWHPDEDNNEIYYDLSNFTRHDVIEIATVIGDTFLLIDLSQLHPVFLDVRDYPLDLAFSNCCGSKAANSKEVLTSIDSYHPPVLFTISLVSTYRWKPLFAYRNFRRANYDVINQELSRIYWDNEFGDLNVDCKLDHFYGRLDALIERYVPLKSRKPFDYPSWSSHDLTSEK